jgi:cytosine/adenosine deaminase-related metal-dependent hydrolase
MWLTDLRLPGKDDTISLCIREGKIAAIVPSPSKHSEEPTLPFDGALVFPGLINSHDHLDFNLFPALANTRYDNYRAWGRDIHSQNADAIQSVLKIPQLLRIRWGIYKNLLNGFTTVVNHGEWLDTTGAPITIHQQCHNLHSIGFERNWRWKLNRPRFTSPPNQPFVLHVGEGTDTTAQNEITQLLQWNIFRRPLIGIHGVAMTEEQATRFRALVWCPASNYFLLHQTAPISRLKHHVPILFGTDSTLTSPWDSWSQIKLARREEAATDEQLLQMLTTAPAAAWNLTDRGSLEKGLLADLVIARPNNGAKGWDAFYTISPDDILLVLSQGAVVLFDPCLKKALTNAGLVNADFLQAGPDGKYVPGDVNDLMRQIRSYHPNIQFPVLPAAIAPSPVTPSPVARKPANQ